MLTTCWRPEGYKIKSALPFKIFLTLDDFLLTSKKKFLERISSHCLITIQMLGHVPCTPRVVCTLSSNCYTMRWSIISLQEAQKFHPQFIGIYGHTHIFYPMSFFCLKRSTSFQGTFFIMSKLDINQIFWPISVFVKYANSNNMLLSKCSFPISSNVGDQNTFWLVASNGPNISSTPLKQWGFRQCLPFSWTTIRGKHLRQPITIMGVVDNVRAWRQLIPNINLLPNKEVVSLHYRKSYF